MNNDRKLRDLLEPEAPRLDPAAATRIEARVRDAARGGSRRMPWMGWAMAAAPALVLAALLFLSVRPGPAPVGYTLVDETSFVEALGQWDSAGLDLGEYMEEALDSDDIDWNDLELDDENRNTFLDELENFDLEII